jgi:hypothetical protein
MKQNVDFEDRYFPATMLLLWKEGGLAGEHLPYDAFYNIIEPVLRPEDFEIYTSVQHSGGDEPCWHTRLRFALLHMREDKYPEDGRIRRLGKGCYEMTDKGRNWLESYFYGAPLDWLELETEECEDGSVLFRYRHPMTGDDLISFGGTYTGPHFAGMKLNHHL